MPHVSLSLDWIEGMKFHNSEGSPAIELHSSTPGVSSPPQALAYALMACMAMDLVHVIQKSRAPLTALTVKFDGERAEEHPRRYVSMHLVFHVTGQVEDKVVARGIDLSRDKYCSVWNTIRPDVELRTSFVVHRS
jgi:putative redox protein